VGKLLRLTKVVLTTSTDKCQI